MQMSVGWARVQHIPSRLEMHLWCCACGASRYPHLCTSDRSSLVLKQCFAVRYNSGVCGCRFCCTHRHPQTMQVSQERQAAARHLLQLLAQPLLWRHTQVGTPRHGAIGVQPPVTAEPCPFRHRLVAPSSSVLVFYQKTKNRGIQKNANRAGTRFLKSAFLRLLAGGLIWVKTKANAPFRPLHVWFMDLLRQRDNPFSSPM